MSLVRTELRIAIEEWHGAIPDYWTKEGTGAVYSHSESLLSLNSLSLEWR